MSFYIKLIFEGVSPSKLLAQAAVLTNKSCGLAGCDTHYRLDAELISRPQGRGPQFGASGHDPMDQSKWFILFPHSGDLEKDAAEYCGHIVTCGDFNAPELGLLNVMAVLRYKMVKRQFKKIYKIAKKLEQFRKIHAF